MPVDVIWMGSSCIWLQHCSEMLSNAAAQSVSVIAGLIPLFIYARQHPTNIILLGVWVGLPCMPPPQLILLFDVRSRAKQSRGCNRLLHSLYGACTRHSVPMVHASSLAGASSAMATILAGLRLQVGEYLGVSVLTHACADADGVHERGAGHGVHGVRASDRAGGPVPDGGDRGGADGVHLLGGA